MPARVGAIEPAADDSPVGRQREVAAAPSLLRVSSVRPVTPTGPGVGKTRQAIEVAARLAGGMDRPVHTHMVPLAAVRAAAEAAISPVSSPERGANRRAGGLAGGPGRSAFDPTSCRPYDGIVRHGNPPRSDR